MILRKGVKEQNIGFIVVIFFFIIMIQKFNSTQPFLEAGKEALWWHILGFLSPSVRVIKNSNAYGNRASIEGYKFKKGVVDLLEGINFVHSIVICNIFVSFMAQD